MFSNEEICFPKKILSISAVTLTVIFLIFTIINEYKYVTYSKELRPIIKNAIPVSCIPLEENNGKIIHINCPLQDLETFYAPSEFSSNIYSFRGVFFEMKVEMYQLVRDYGNLGLYTRGKFEDHIVRTPYNFLFFFKRRKNPTFMPAIGNVGRKYANYAKAGNYRLPKNSLINFQKKKKLDLVDDGWFIESEVKPPFTIDHLNTNVYDNYLYTGDPLNPQVGDIRISFYGSTAAHATIVGVQKSRLMNTIFEIDGISVTNHKMILLSEDNKTMINQIKDFIHKNYGNITSLWLFRIITCFFISTQIFSFLSDNSRNIFWRFSVSIITSSIVLSLFPCVFWFFCDTAVFLFLFVLIFLMSISLLFLCNGEMDDGYNEMKNYMKRSVTEPTNYTFLNIPDENGDMDDDYNYQKNNVNVVFGSNSDISFSQSINKQNRAQSESSPTYIYHN
ncbi:conserved Plasmodium protein, unknown function [Plasmodium gallinaceum]|uniref:Transmembrane protein 43 n=1 Tax=Plasmodium gallinaceum TaxID=5849 RepID=A0A1J1GR57_PLAGA|nr:conserved Plasmodium protein, unknown function [Plasmodium gallinaceum]CRG94913.1 conserved Plasmodium protein, unknown function [Plasmodium gallinaceum]